MNRAPRLSLLLTLATSGLACSDAHDATTASPVGLLDGGRALDGGASLDGGALLDAGSALVTAAQCLPLGTTCTSQPVPSWKTDVAPAIQRSCAAPAGCHTGNPSDPWPLGDRDDFQEWGPSVLNDLQDCTMPPADSGVALTVQDRQTMSQWLHCGAPNN